MATRREPEIRNGATAALIIMEIGVMIAIADGDGATFNTATNSA